MIEIPKGFDSVSFMGNLVFVLLLKKLLFQTKVPIFSNILKFIDDLWTVNNNEFVKSYKYIFSDELGPTRESEDKASLLNNSIEVHARKFTTELFDKTDVFPFYMNFIFYFDSNKPSKPCYVSIGS